MNIVSCGKIQSVIKTISVIAAMVVATVGFIYFHTDPKTVFILILFLLSFVLIPGNFMVKRIGLGSEYASTTYARSFFAGFALNIVLYYLAEISRINLVLLIVPLVMTLLWLIQMIRGAGFSEYIKKSASLFKTAPASAFVFTFLVFLSSMFASQYSYIPPNHAAFSFIKLDFAYHAGIINALSVGYPPMDPWVDKFTIYYHFYSEMLLSIPMRLFHLTSENMLMMGTPYLIAPVLSISLYAFFKEFSARKEFSGVYCLAFHFSNMLILKNPSDSWFLYHIYSNINNTGLGVSCMLTALVLLKTWDEKSESKLCRFNTKEMLFFGVLVMLMTGIKGPVALVLVGGMVGATLLGLILRTATKEQIAATALSSISFVLIFVFVLAAQHDNASGGSAFNIGEVTDIFYLKDSIMEFFSSNGLPHATALLVLFVVFVVFFLSAFLVPFTIGYIREFWLTVTRKKEFRFSRIVVYAMWMVGFLGVMILDFSGHSQVYFGFVSCMLTPIIAFWFLEDLHGNTGRSANSIRAIFAVCLTLFSAVSLMNFDSSVTEAKNTYQARNEEKEKYRCVSTAEYEGLMWLKNNTDGDALIASDRFNSVSMDDYDVTKRNNNTHFAYAIYSQRRQYLEGSGFSLELESQIRTRQKMYRKLLPLYDSSNNNRGNEARDLGVDYLVVSKRFGPRDSLENDDYETCFTNEHMDIYKIKEAS